VLTIQNALTEKIGIVERKKKISAIKQKLVNILSKFQLNFY